MRIAISLLNFRAGSIGGTETYLRELVRAIVPLARNRSIELVLVCRSDNAADFRDTGAEIVTCPAGDRRIIAERIGEALGLWRARAAEQAFAQTRADVVLMPQQTAFPLRPGRPYVLVVHDLQHIERPAMLPPFDRHFRPRAFPPALSGAKHVIAISHVVRNLLITSCAVPATKVTTVHHGAADLKDRHLPPFTRVPTPFLYYPAATHKHKGHSTLLRTFSTLIKDPAFANWKLVLSGQQTSEWPKLDNLITDLGLRENVIHLGFVPFNEVLAAYAAAAAIVFPSEYEGFGLPVLEAAQFGKKIITSQLPVFQELGVPPQRRIDFRNADELKKALSWDGPALEQPPRTWGQCARETLDVLTGSPQITHYTSEI